MSDELKAAREAASNALDAYADSMSVAPYFLANVVLDAFLSELSLTSVVVPRNATPKMIQAGYDASVENGDFSYPEEGDWIPRINNDVWKAMIEAASRSEASGRGE